MTYKEVHRIVDEALEKTKQCTSCINPLEAWSMFTQEVDRIGRGAIGSDMDTGEGTPPKVTEQFRYDDYRQAFLECCPSLPKPNAVDKWTANRKKALRAKKMSVDEFRDICKRVERSDFLTGRDGKWQGCSFDWILKPANWQKIMEGNYENKKEISHTEKSTGREASYDLDEYMQTALNAPLKYQKRRNESG